MSNQNSSRRHWAARLSALLPATLAVAVLLVALDGVAPRSHILASSTDAPPVSLVLTRFAEGLDFPVFVTHAGDGSGRLFAPERAGRVRTILPDGTLLAEPFLDISDRVKLDHAEQGLLGLAFHPDFANNHRFYVDYIRRSDGATVISEFIADGDTAAADSERPLIVVPQPGEEHNGGMITFDHAGRLLASLGDGSYDPVRRPNPQDPDVMLGKIIALDVDSAEAYALDAQARPLAGSPRPEVVAQGLRNPWRFSVDRESGDIFIGDVGLDSWEEIDVVAAGSPTVDFGWFQLEGPQCGPLDHCAPGAFTSPAVAYPHEPFGSVIGGYAYRGVDQPLLDGLYLFGDFSRGRINAAPVEAMLRGAADSFELMAEVPGGVVSFGEDEQGELYVVTTTSIERISAEPPDPADLPEAPQTLPAYPVIVTSALDISDVAILPAEAMPGDGIPIKIFYTNDVEASEAPGGCVSLAVTGVDPFIGLAYLPETRLYVEPELSGVMQVFLDHDGVISEEQSIRSEISASPYEITGPASPTGAAIVIRIDPPGEGTTIVCLVSPATSRLRGW